MKLFGYSLVVAVKGRTEVGMMRIKITRVARTWKVDLEMILQTLTILERRVTIGILLNKFRKWKRKKLNYACSSIMDLLLMFIHQGRKVFMEFEFVQTFQGIPSSGWEAKAASVFCVLYQY